MKKEQLFRKSEDTDQKAGDKRWIKNNREEMHEDGENEDAV